jgi:hypothetical protein
MSCNFPGFGRVTATEFERKIDGFVAKFEQIYLSKIFIYIIRFSVYGRVTGNDSLFDLIIAKCSSSFLKSVRKSFTKGLIKIGNILRAVSVGSSGVKDSVPSFKNRYTPSIPSMNEYMSIDKIY